MTKLTIDIIRTFRLRTRQYIDCDHYGDFPCFEVYLPSGIILNGQHESKGELIDNHWLIGLGGHIEIDTKEELEELISMNKDETFKSIEKEYPNFNREHYS